MPEYSFKCDKCEEKFSEFFMVADYDSRVKKSKCPACKSKKVHRDFLADDVTPNYIKGVHEATTLGELADKRSKKLGKRTVEGMKEDFKTKPKNTLESKLKDGATITSYADTGRLSKTEIDKKRNLKK
jgi:putative FmdB family regulatory protein